MYHARKLETAGNHLGAAEKYENKCKEIVNKLESLLNVKKEKILERVKEMQKKWKQNYKTIERLRKEFTQKIIENLKFEERENILLLVEEIKDAEIVLGRERLKNYAWRDPGTISRIHVKFKKEGDKYYVYDEGSTNGTYIEGQDIRGKGKVELKDGTEIRLVNPDYPVIVLRFKKEVRS